MLKESLEASWNNLIYYIWMKLSLEHCDCDRLIQKPKQPYKSKHSFFSMQRVVLQPLGLSPKMAPVHFYCDTGQTQK